MKRLAGIPLSSGYASGIAVVYDFAVGCRLEVPTADLTNAEVESEWQRLDNALERSQHELQLLQQPASGRPNLGKSVAVLSAWRQLPATNLRVRTEDSAQPPFGAAKTADQEPTNG